jgi:hypothetical protein
VEKRKNETEAYDDRVVRKHPWATETYDNYEKNYQISKDMLIFRYSKEFFLLEGEKLDPERNKYHKPVTPLKKLDDAYLIIRERDKIEATTPSASAANKATEAARKRDEDEERSERGGKDRDD